MAYNSKQAAWGEALVLLSVGGIIAFLKPSVGIPILLCTFILGVILIIRAYRKEYLTRRFLNPDDIIRDANRRTQMEQFIVLGTYCFVAIGIGVLSVLFYKPAPMLAFDIKSPGAMIITENRTVVTETDFVITNLTKSPAYQTKFRLCSSLLLNPSDIFRLPDITESNPIKQGEVRTIPWKHSLTYTGDGLPDGVVLIYVNLRYSNATTGGKFANDEYWLAYRLNADNRTMQIFSQTLEQKNIFKPFVENHLSTYNSTR